MKLGTLKSKISRDGDLVVISEDNLMAVLVPDIAANLREAVESWETTESALKSTFDNLNAGKIEGAFAVNISKFHSPLPRTFQWADGSPY